MQLAYKIDPCSEAENVQKKPGEVIKLFDSPLFHKPATRRANIPHRAESLKSLDDIRAIQKFFLDNKRYRDYALFTTGICTGLRISDLCSLNINDVKNDDGTYKEYIDIYEKKTGKKSSDTDDKCLITEAIVKALDVYFKHRGLYSKNEPLFVSRKINKYGTYHLAPESGWRIIKQAQRSIGFNYNIGSHSMRKTFANAAACLGGKSNIDMNKLLQVQHMLKHSDYKTTMSYLNLNSVFTAEARRNVSDFVLGKTEYNDLTEALMDRPDDESSKLDLIIKLLNDLEVD